LLWKLFYQLFIIPKATLITEVILKKALGAKAERIVVIA